MKYDLPLFYDYVFGNIVLPNALPSEMAIVNYIHSQHSCKLDRQSYFDTDFDNEDSGFRRIFGDEMGQMPSAIFNNGTYINSDCYKDIINVEEHALYFGRRKKSRYIYPIKPTLHFERFTGFDNLGSKLNGEFFWKHMSALALNDARTKNALIFLDWSNENFIDKETYIDLHNALSRSGIPKSQIVLTINSFNAEELYNNWFTEEEQRLQVKNLPYLLSNISYFYNVTTSSRVDKTTFLLTKDRLRSNYFIFPNRRGRPHRIALLHALESNDLLSKGDWSFLDNNSLDNGLHESQQVFDNLNFDRIRDLHSRIPKSLSGEEDKTFTNTSGWYANMNTKPYLNSYFYIASETYIHGEYKSLTEKVFKPIANFQPFLFVAFPGALEQLRNLGFRTFHPFIDESYDLEKDSKVRLNMILNEVKRLCAMPKDDIHKWFVDMIEILLHNRNHLLGIYKNESNTMNFFKFLHDRIKD